MIVVRRPAAAADSGPGHAGSSGERVRPRQLVRLRHEDGGRHTTAGEGAGSVTEDSSRAAWLRQARSYLRNADPVLARLIDDRPDFDPRAWMAQLPPMDLYGALLFQVTGQQLSVPATRRTLARIQALFGGLLPAAAELLAVDPSQLRQAGLSWRKINTLRGDLALRKAIRAAYQLDHLPAQDEVLAIAEKWRPYRSLATSYLFSAAFEPTEAPPVARLGSA